MLNHSSARLLDFVLSVLSEIYKAVLQIWGQKGPWAVGVMAGLQGGCRGRSHEALRDAFLGC